MDHQIPELARIDRQGGWRFFMQHSELDAANALMGLEAQIESLSSKLALARAFVLAKHGRVGDARAIVDHIDRQCSAGDIRDDGITRDLVLVDTHVRIYEDRPLTSETGEKLSGVLDQLPPRDLIGQALALNLMCITSLHTGNFDKAQEQAEGAIRLYRQQGGEFGSLHLLTHLGQIKLMRGDLEGAEAQYKDLERRLALLKEDTNGLMAVCYALRSEVAYEANALSRADEYLLNSMSSIEDDDAWLDVRAAAYRVRIRLAYLRNGLPGALTELAHCERAAMHRDMPRLFRLMQVERIRVLTLSDEIDMALTTMRSIGLSPENADWSRGGDWALRHGSIAVAIARWLVRSRRCLDALTFAEPVEDFAIRGGQLLPLAKMRVIKAAAHWRLNQRGDATRSLLSALRLLGRQPFSRFILDEGAEMLSIVRAALDGDHVGVPPTPELRRRLSELSHAWTMETGRVQVPMPTGANGGQASDEFRQKYIELLALGLSNKEIGRTMGVTVNTVKYHLKAIFRELRVDSRTRAIAEARRLRIIHDDHTKE